VRGLGEQVVERFKLARLLQWRKGGRKSGKRKVEMVKSESAADLRQSQNGRRLESEQLGQGAGKVALLLKFPRDRTHRVNSLRQPRAPPPAPCRRPDTEKIFGDIRAAPSAICSHPPSPHRARQGWRFRLESTLYF
jgi:hypothetical protein